MQKTYFFILISVIVALVVTIIICLSVLLPRKDDNDDVATVVVPVPTMALTSTQFDVPQGGSRISIIKSSPDRLLTLVVLASDGTSFKPVGRSYNGRDWETSAGEFAGSVLFVCEDSNNGTNMDMLCSVDLPGLPNDGSRYQITLFNKPEYYTDRDVVARFLEQTTFGGTKEEIDTFVTAGTYEFAQWIQDQQQSKVMSHRELYRRHMNAQFPVHNPTGPVTGPCQVGCRYRRTSFSVKDTDRVLTIRTLVPGPNNQTDGTGRFKKALLIDGNLRTIVDSTAIYVAGEDFFEEVELQDGDYVVCYVVDVFESVDIAYSVLLVNHPDYGDCTSIFFQLSAEIFQSNPLVGVEGVDSLNGTGIQMPLVLDILDEDAEPIDLVYTQAFIPVQQGIILRNAIEGCPAMTYSNIESPTFVRWQNTVYLHDPHFVLLDNTVTDPLHDGGGEIVATLSNPYRPDFTTLCSNVPRSFLNEYGCYLSGSMSACSYVIRGDEYDQSYTEPAEALFRINHDSIRAIYNATGAGEVGTVYLYAIDNLNITLDPTVDPPCKIGSVSRWVPGECTGEGPSVTVTTSQLIGGIVSWFKEEVETNEYLLDIYHPDDLGSFCSERDMNAVGFEVVDNEDSTKCWRNVHPDHWNIYDFSEWVSSHPGNSANRNPIKEFAENGNSTLVYPNWHELSRWNDYKVGFGYGPVRYGDMYNFFYLPYEHITEELAEILGLTLDAATGGSETNSTDGFQGPTMVCGSPFEVRNDPWLGGQQERGAFDTSTTMYQTTYDGMIPQKRAIWIRTVLEDPGQLRQRMAWALSQILVISPSGITDGDFLTEAFVSYYDIFVRNAFGNYRTILKEVSYSPQMGDMLTYIGGRSTSIVLEEEGNIEYPDENFAREGLFILNKDGTEVRNSEGIIQSVYSNDDIEEYARAWTGFVQPVRRGNLEGDYANRIDPMRVVEKWRDRSPKMGLNRKYIGDGYPLCIDLPAQHFLKKGAKYRLLGGSPNPEMQLDPAAWLRDKKAVRLDLNPDGGLYSKLCSLQLGRCLFHSTVVLDESVECFGTECEVDTVRVVQVDNVFYEYIRQPCVYQAFFPSGNVAARKVWAGDRRVCSDPRIESAVPACCVDGANSTFHERYWGERTTYKKALQRCGGSPCDLETFPSCENEGTDSSQCLDDGFFWTSVPCSSRVKVNAKGKVAVVHSIPSYVEDENLASMVDGTTQTYFRVDWLDGYDTLDCEAIESCELTTDNACVCDVTIEDEIVFEGPEVPTKLEIERLLHVGAIQHHVTTKFYDDVNVFNPENQELFSKDTVFEFIDEFGVVQRRKNIKSTVAVIGTNLKFRNPPHFMSFVEETSRDAHYETDATLDHYFYHLNTAPFLAIRFAQRFGISNPSPRFVETIATAFKSGLYTYSDESGTVEFGTGSYGDLSSTVAAVLLDPEARDITLDSDPTHGAFKEPIIKTMGILRSMRLRQRASSPWVDISAASIGQMAHDAPSVFSFFLPEYQPPGRIAKGSLVAPEGQVLTGPRVVDNLNAFFSLLKYGMTSCYGGFVPEGRLEYFGVYDCDGLILGGTPEERNLGVLEYQPSEGISTESLVNELATLLTSGRLSLERRQIIQQMFDDTEDDNGLIKAQMMIAASPEFHVTNLVRPGRIQREETPPPPPASKSYKALVNILLPGGVDSFNMLAPHQCTSTNVHGQTLLEQYNIERSTLALSEEERTRVIDVVGQPCEQFAVHPDLPIVEKLYNDGDLAFFANIGQLDVPVAKDDYYILTQTELFSHNTMQYTAQSVDPWKTSPGTGILGRMCDALAKNGFQAQPISIQEATVATVGVPGENKGPLVVSATGLNKFAPRPEGEVFDIKPYATLLTNETDIHSSIFGETYMETLVSAITTSDRLFDAFEGVELTQTYPTEENPYVGQIQTLSSLILTHDDRGSDRDVFFLSLGEWDHHESMKASLSAEFLLLNEALTLFEQEMKGQSYYENVTVVVTTDFGRTLTANSGSGSDHAWGGNTFAFGGAVHGGVIHGEYPSDITASGPLNLGRGRLIPTLSWESLFNPIIEWMGVVSDEDLDYCMPNRHKTGTRLYSSEEVFLTTKV